MQTDRLGTEHRGIGGAFSIAAAVMAVLVLVQAVLVGQGVWRAAEFPNFIEFHGFVGNAVFVVAIAQAALALYGMTRRIIGGNVAILNLIILGLVVTQIGLGYAGRESAVAVSWHVPNGVLLFGLTVLNATLALSQRRTSET